MAENSFIKKLFKKRTDRRDFLADQIKLFAAGALFSWPLSMLVSVKPVQAAGQSRASGFRTKKGQKKTYPIHPMAKKFIGENLKYTITFLGAINAAEGTIKFRKGSGYEYVGELEAKTTGIAKVVSSYRRMKFTAYMGVKEFGGKERFVSNRYVYEREKGENTYISTFFMLYNKKRRVYRKTKNGKLIRSSKEKMRNDRPMDDFVVATFNFRAGNYGKPKPEKKYEIDIIPFKKVTKFKCHIASKKEYEKQKWAKKIKKGKHLLVVNIDQKIFGIKAGKGYILGDKDMVPITARVSDSISFGNVTAKLVKRG